MVPLRPQASRRCLDNLIANARAPRHQVGITVAGAARSRRDLIDDNGPGIPAHAREDVFKPFYRLDASRNPATGGVGLGLTIARDFVRGHGGEITLGDFGAQRPAGADQAAGLGKIVPIEAGWVSDPPLQRDRS